MEIQSLQEKSTSIQNFSKRPSRSSKVDPVVIIGAGPAGLMAAEVLAGLGLQVHLYEAMPSAGRKLLVAGRGGLNLTHSEPFECFIAHYGKRQSQLEPFLRSFGPQELRVWASGVGIETFIGSSGRVFPVGMRSFPLLRLWLARLRANGVVFHFRHRWTGWNPNHSLCFDTPLGNISVPAGATILALGGGSWPVTGSNGDWIPILAGRGIPVQPLKPANCGFNVDWTEHFRSRFAGIPLKAVRLTFTDSSGQVFTKTGEFVITRYGVEGGLIYACSALLRDEIESMGSALIHLDLAPDWTHERLIARLSRPRGSRSTASMLEKSIAVRGVKAGMLWEFVAKPVFSDPPALATAIKNLPVPVLTPRPLAEAISSAGGVDFSALDENLMLCSLPGVFCAGEMLDWEAPTGGYLLNACIATGRAAGMGALRYLQRLKG